MATVFMLIGIIFVSVILVMIPIMLGMGMGMEQERYEGTLVFLTFLVLFELSGLIVLLSVLIL